MNNKKVKEHFGCVQNNLINGQQERLEWAQENCPRPEKFYFGAYPGIIGIEIEVEHFPQIESSPLWSCSKDGSLKDGGKEFISTPMQGKTIDYALQSITKLFRDLNTHKWYFNHRCSVHVHLNVANITCHQLVNLIGLYIRLEPYFFAFADPMREGNSYCYPLADSLPKQEQLFNNPDWRSNTKYASLGMNHLHDYGTVELRILEGTIDIVRLRRWILMLQKLFKYILVNKLNDKLIEFYDTKTSQELAKEVFNTLYKFLPQPLEQKLNLAKDSSLLFLTA